MPADLIAKIARNRWKIKFIPLRHHGECTKQSKTITIKQSLSDRKMLETLIHEILHAEYWQIADEFVEETAADIARVLWRLGYRRRV